MAISGDTIVVGAIGESSDTKAIINGAHWGMIFHNEAFRPLERGKRMPGFIKQVRSDGKIDLCLQKPGYEKVTDLTEVILCAMDRQGGSIPLTCKSPADAIYRQFGVSKKSFKQAIGALYKKRRIMLEEHITRRV